VFLLCCGLLLGCQKPPVNSALHAGRINSEHELVGGPLAQGQVGDYLIQNDRVRFVISGAHHSWGPGLLGGTVVDADLRRTGPQFRGGKGKDQFAELFPVANLLVPDPTATDISVTQNGFTDTSVAQIRVTGRGVFYLEGLSLLDAQGTGQFAPLLSSLGLQTAFNFETLYTLRPGQRYLEIETIMQRLPDAVGPACQPLEGCDLDCPMGYRTDPASLCLQCKCDEETPLEHFTEPIPMLERLLGDAIADYNGEDAVKPGIIAGDFLFFGGGTNIFTPGLGFDEKGPVFENLSRGVDTITSPMTFDWVASVGDDVSYALFTAHEEKPEPSDCTYRIVLTGLTQPGNADELNTVLTSTYLDDLNENSQKGTPKENVPPFLGDKVRRERAIVALREQRIPLPIYQDVANDPALVEAVEDAVGSLATVGVEPHGNCRSPKLLVPLFTSSATMVVSSGLSCRVTDALGNDDESCDERRTYRFKRYLAVGEGDVNSAARLVHDVREEATGVVRGAVLEAQTLRPIVDANVFVLRDPDPEQTFTNYDEVVALNHQQTGNLGIVNQALTDVGVDPKQNGQYSLVLPTGSWILVARSPDKVLSVPHRVTVTGTVEKPGDHVVHPLVNQPARLHYRVLDGSGSLTPAKLTLQALDGKGDPLQADGKRRVELGSGRMDDGIFHIVYSKTGLGNEAVEAGRYRVTASRGIEFGLDTAEVHLMPGQNKTVELLLRRQVDTTGWISGDFHLHAEPSFDSGIDLNKRVLTNILEGVELLSSSDHDAVTDYGPTLKAMGMESYATTQIGTEVSPLEMGHFLGFPIQFDATDVPTHGAIDWVCKSHHELFAEIKALGSDVADDNVIAVAHPRDGFLGYFDQFGLNPWTLVQEGGGLEANNPLFRSVSCDFDAMELLNGKRFELLRTPTVVEINDANRCIAELNDAVDHEAVRNACAWLREPPECDGNTERVRGEPCQWYADMNQRFQDCTNGIPFSECKDIARNASTILWVRRNLYRTHEEQDAWHGADETQRNPDLALCSPSALAAIVAGESTLTEGDQLAPCSQHEGVADDWFQLLNHGLNITVMGNSDSHGTSMEPGASRTYIQSSTDDASHIDLREIAKNIKSHRAIATTGPFVEVSVGDASIGDTLRIQPDESVQVRIKVQTADWFGVSRIEIYGNGQLLKGIDTNKPATAIVDFDDVVDLGTLDKDTWITVTTFGLRDQDFMAPVYHTVPLGELGLDKITTLAFGNLPDFISSLLGNSSQLPDFFPTIPYAMTNPIWLDVDGDADNEGFGNVFEPVMGSGLPPFCPRMCTPAADDDGNPTQSNCPKDTHVCYPNADVGRPGDGGTCGLPIPGQCTLGMGQLESGLSVAPLPATQNNDWGGLLTTDIRKAGAHIGPYILDALQHGVHAHTHDSDNH